MGGGASWGSKNSGTASSSFMDHNARILISALRKLAPLFEADNELSTNLTGEIMDRKHVDFPAQFAAVKVWLRNHNQVEGAESEVTAEEIDYLIQYVELYFDDNQEVPIINDNSKREDTNICPLMYPHRADLAFLPRGILSEEAKSISPATNSVNIRFPESQSHRSSEDPSRRFSDRQTKLRFSSSDTKSERLSSANSESIHFFDCQSDSSEEEYSNHHTDTELPRFHGHLSDRTGGHSVDSDDSDDADDEKDSVYLEDEGRGLTASLIGPPAGIASRD